MGSSLSYVVNNIEKCGFWRLYAFEKRGKFSKCEERKIIVRSAHKRREREGGMGGMS